MRILSCLVLASTFVLGACGSDDSDPADDSGGSSAFGGSAGTSSGGNGGSGGSGASTSGGSGGSGGSAGSTSGGSGGQGGSSGSAGSGGSGGAQGGSAGTGGSSGSAGQGGSGGTGGAATCPPDNVTFLGQVTAPDNTDVPNGGIYTTDSSEAAYVDSGLDDVIAAGTGISEPTAVDIDVTGAVIVATNFFNDQLDPPPNASTFWLADANGAIEVRLDFNMMDCCAPFDVRVGHKIDMKVTEVDVFGGKPQISKATMWNLQSADNYVLVEEPTGALSGSDYLKMVRLTGTVAGPAEACGGDSFCWTLNYGSGASIEYRTESDFVEDGQCMTWVGPVGDFQGMPQLNEDNFDWTWTYD